MASLYADENFNGKVVQLLLQFGHDVLTAHEAGKAGQGIEDPDVLAHAISLQRAVLTHNRKHFVKLHNPGQQAEEVNRRVALNSGVGFLLCPFSVSPVIVVGCRGSSATSELAQGDECENGFGGSV